MPEKTLRQPIGLTREMLGIDQAVVAGRNRHRSIEDVKQYIVSELEAEYQRGYRAGIDEGYNQCELEYMTKLQDQEKSVNKARVNVLRNCLEAIIKALDSSPEELIKVLQEETL